MKKKILAFALVAMLLATCLIPCAAFAIPSDIKPINPNPGSSETTDQITGSFMDDNGVTWNVHQGVYPIVLEYLERIPDTPFAELKTYKMNFPFTYAESTKGAISVTEGLDIPTLLNKLKLKSFGVLQSYVKEITYKSRSNGVFTFRAKYFDTYYLNAKTSDGCFDNFYIGCNESFKTFFNRELGLGLFTQNDLDVFSNSIYAAYAEQLGTYQLDEIYGYWSFVGIPQSYTWNGFFNDIGGGTFMSPNIFSMTFLHHIDYSKYVDLNSEFGMSFFYQFMNLYGNFFSKSVPECYCYLSFLDGGDVEILITQNGSTSLEDNSGAMINEAEDFIEGVDWGALITGPTAAALVIGLVLLVGFLLFRKRKK